MSAHPERDSPRRPRSNVYECLTAQWSVLPNSLADHLCARSVSLPAWLSHRLRGVSATSWPMPPVPTGEPAGRFAGTGSAEGGRVRRSASAACPPFREALTLGPIVDAVRQAVRSRADLADLELSALAGTLRPHFPEWADEVTLERTPGGGHGGTRRVDAGRRAGRVAFRHALAGQAVYDGARPADRRAAHRRAAALLESVRPRLIGKLAHHFREAGNTARWCAYTEQAADVALVSGDHLSAVTLPHELISEPSLPAEAVAPLVRKMPFPGVHRLCAAHRGHRRSACRPGDGPAQLARPRRGAWPAGTGVLRSRRPICRSRRIRARGPRPRRGHVRARSARS